MRVKSESEVAQSCLTLRDPMDCSPPGSSVHGSFQARVPSFPIIGTLSVGADMTTMYMQREEGVNTPALPSSLRTPRSAAETAKTASWPLCYAQPSGKAGEGCLKHCWDSVSLSVKWHGHQGKHIHSILRPGWACLEVVAGFELISDWLMAKSHKQWFCCLEKFSCVLSREGHKRTKLTGKIAVDFFPT